METATLPSHITAASGWTLRDLLRMEVRLMAQAMPDCPYPYQGPRDFVLQLGSGFPWRPLPDGMRMRAAKQCYENAARLTLREPKKFLYVEGIALGVIAPVPHAWCIDREGYVVDPTWRNVDERRYFGVPFETSYLRRRLYETVEHGALIDVFEGDERWPLCRGIHSIEEAVADLGEWLS